MTSSFSSPPRDSDPPRRESPTSARAMTVSLSLSFSRVSLANARHTQRDKRESRTIGDAEGTFQFGNWRTFGEFAAFVERNDRSNDRRRDSAGFYVVPQRFPHPRTNLIRRLILRYQIVVYGARSINPFYIRSTERRSPSSEASPRSAKRRGGTASSVLKLGGRTGAARRRRRYYPRPRKISRYRPGR